MKVFINQARTQAVIEYSTHTFTLTSDSDVMDLVAIWTLPVEAWDSSDTINAARVLNSAEETA